MIEDEVRDASTVCALTADCLMSTQTGDGRVRINGRYRIRVGARRIQVVTPPTREEGIGHKTTWIQKLTSIFVQGGASQLHIPFIQLFTLQLADTPRLVVSKAYMTENMYQNNVHLHK